MTLALRYASMVIEVILDSDIVDFRLLPSVYANFSLGATDGVLRTAGWLEEESYRLTGKKSLNPCLCESGSVQSM